MCLCRNISNCSCDTSDQKYLLMLKLNYWQCIGDIVIYVQRPESNLNCVAFLAGVLVFSNHFLYRHSTELLLNLRSDPATCYLHPSLPDPLLHNSPCGQRFCYVSTRATDSRREIHKPCVRAEKKKSASVLTHLLKTEWSAKFVWEGFWRCPAALSVQHMLQALASPIAFQVIGQAQQEVGF